jgi:hypothetical protein
MAQDLHRVSITTVPQSQDGTHAGRFIHGPEVMDEWLNVAGRPRAHPGHYHEADQHAYPIPFHHKLLHLVLAATVSPDEAVDGDDMTGSCLRGVRPRRGGS